MTFTPILLFMGANSMILLLTNSSILMMVTVIAQTFLVCVAFKSITNTSWISFILFLVFVGGLLVLFIYIVSLTPNTLIMIKSSTLASITLMVVAVIVSSTLSPKDFCISSPNPLNIHNTDLFIKMYSIPSAFITLMAMTYLLLVLVIIVHIILTDRSPMKSLMIKS